MEEKIAETSQMQNWSDVAKCNEQLCKSVTKIIKDGKVCLTVGGDHSIGVGSVTGHGRGLGPKRAGLALLWIDAHADINTWSSSLTGNCHGMSILIDI